MSPYPARRTCCITSVAGLYALLDGAHTGHLAAALTATLILWAIAFTAWGISLNRTQDHQ